MVQRNLIKFITLCMFFPLMLQGCLITSGHKKHAEKGGEVAKMPKIEVMPESWDFGEVIQLKMLTQNFTVKNSGTANIYF